MRSCRHTPHSENKILLLGELRDFLWSPNLPPQDPFSGSSPAPPTHPPTQQPDAFNPAPFCFSFDETVRGHASPKFQAHSSNTYFQHHVAPPAALPLPHVDPRGDHGGEELFRGHHKLWGDAGVRERVVPCRKTGALPHILVSQIYLPSSMVFSLAVPRPSQLLCLT